MDVDSLICLNSVEKSAFGMLRLKNAKKSLANVVKTLEESFDSTFRDTGEDGILQNSDFISNFLESNNSSTAALSDLIEVFTTTIKELKNISDKRKIDNLNLKPSDELVMQPDKDHPISEKSRKYTNPPDKKNEISRRYPDLFEIFSEESKSQLSNLSLISEIETWTSKNNGRSFNYAAPEKFVENPKCRFQNFQTSKINCEDAEVSSDKNSTFRPMKDERLHQESTGNIKEEILLQKFQSLNFQNNIETLEKRRDYNHDSKIVGEPQSLMSLRKEIPTSDFKTQIQNFSFPEKLTHSKNCKEAEINLKRGDELKIHESRSSSVMNRISSSLENVPPLSSTILSSRTEASNSSLNSWRTLRDSPRGNAENDFPGASFNSRSIYELEVDSKRVKPGIKRSQLKLKTGDRNKIKKKRKLSLNVEKFQGHIEFKKSRVLVVKSDTKIKSEDLKTGIDSERQKKKNKILTDVLNILLEVKSNLLSNRKLAESIQERFQSCSVLQTVVSIDAVKSLNKGISRCSMSIQSGENNREMIFGVEELLLDSVLRLKEAVKEEKDYLKQQEYYYCKQLSEVTKNNRRRENLKRTTLYTLIGNDSSFSLSQKEEIEELISYVISLIKKILPKNDVLKKDFNPENSRKRNPMNHVRTEPDTQTQIEIFSKPKELSDRLNKTENKRKAEVNVKSDKEQIKPKPRVDPTFIKQNAESLKTNKKYLSNEKFTRSSTLVIHGSNKDSKQTSNQALKLTNKGRWPSTTQPVWKPAGNAKATIAVPPILRPKTRPILSSSDKKNEGLTRNQDTLKNISTKGALICNSKSDIPKSSTNLKSPDLKKSVIRFLKDQKKETQQKSKSGTRNADLMSKNEKDPQKENLISNQQVLRSKRISKQPEAIKMLKEIIKNTSKEDIINSKKSPSNSRIQEHSKNVVISEYENEMSIRFLRSRNQIESSRSSFASTSMIERENSTNRSKLEFKSGKTSSKSENPLKNSAESKNLLKLAGKPKIKCNFIKSRVQLEEDRSRSLKSSSERTSKSERKNSFVKSVNERKVSPARIIDSRSKTIIKDDKLEDKESKNVSLNCSRSNNLRSGSETKVSKPFLRKNSNNSSYLQTYIKLNSRQNLALNNYLKSPREKIQVRREKSEHIFDTLSENEIKSEAEKIQIEDKMKSEEKEVLMSSNSRELIDFNLEPEDISFSPEYLKSSECLTKISSSKYCQVSFESSISSRITGDFYSDDLNDTVESEVNCLETDNHQSSEDFNAKEKRKSFNKHTKSLLILKDILQNHGLNVDLVDEAERKLRSKQKVSKPFYYNKVDGTLLAICSSKTLFDKLESLPDTSFEELEIKDAINQCSFETLDQEGQVPESQQYFETSETSFSSLSDKKSRSSFSKYSLFLTNTKDTWSSNQKMSIFPQTNFSSSKSEESQTLPGTNAHIETEKPILENLVYTDVEVSCSLENSFVSRKEASTGISLIRCCNEVETQTRFNSEKETITDFDRAQLKIEDANSSGVNIEREKENSEMDSFLENENLGKLNKNISLLNSFSKENINEEVKLESWKEDSEMESVNLARISEEESRKKSENICQINDDLFVRNSFTKKEIDDGKEEAKSPDNEEESGKDNKNICQINKTFFADSRKEIDELQDIEEESKNICKISRVVSTMDSLSEKEESKLENLEKYDVMTSVCEREISDHQELSILNSEKIDKETKEFQIKEKEEVENKFEVSISFFNLSKFSIPALKLPELEEMGPIREEINTFLNLSSSYEEIPCTKYFSKSDITTIQDPTSETSSQIKLISKLKVSPFHRVFCNTQISAANSSKSKMETESFKNLKQAQFFEKYKKISQNKRRKGNIRKCKNCGGKCRDSFNLSCPSEVLRTKNQNFFSPEMGSSDNLSMLMKCENRSKNLAVETLKIATRRAKNLYEDVVLCRKKLSPRSENSIEVKLFRGKMKRPFEEPKRPVEDNLYLKLSKRKKKAEDTESDLYCISKENVICEKKLMGSEDFFLEKKPNYLTISNFKSKTLKTTTLQNLQNCERPLTAVPEVKDAMTSLFENVEKYLEENENDAFNLEKREDEEKNVQLEFGNNFSGSCLLPIVYIIGAICSIIFWCLYSSTIYEA